MNADDVGLPELPHRTCTVAVRADGLHHVFWNRDPEEAPAGTFLYTADQMRAYASRAVAQAVPEGWVLVPREPTREMLDAAWDNGFSGPGEDDQPDFAAAYRAMLAATPPTAGEQENAK
jgi:hypothetical protein